MGFWRSTKGSYQLKSVSLRTNEEFLYLYNSIVEDRQLSVQYSFVCDDRQEIKWCRDDRQDFKLCRRVFQLRFDYWNQFQKRIKDVDQLMKRAEKNAHLSEVLAGIMLPLEQLVFPALTELRNFSFKDISMNFNESAWIRLEGQTLLLEDLFAVFADSVSSGLESAHKVVVSALALLSFVYQYLVGCMGKGGSKTYSPGSFLFRLIFVAIVLFLGSYVWIKFRQASYTASRRKRKSGDESDVPRGVYRRAVKGSRGFFTHYKYEPRLKPRREKLESGTSVELNHLPLGSYDTSLDAANVCHIAAVLYGKEEGRPVQFEDGVCLPFPSVTELEKCPPSGKEKALWVTHKSKELYAELLREKARRLQLLHLAVETTGSDHGHAGEACCSDPSPSAPGAPSTTNELICFTPPLGGKGVVEQATTSQSYGLGLEPPVAPGPFSAFFLDSDFDEVIRSMPQLKETEFPATDDPDKVVGAHYKSDHVFGFESTSVPPHSSALDIPTSAIVVSLPQLGVGGQGLKGIESHLNSDFAITSLQSKSLPEQVQLQLPRQEKRPDEFAGSNVELQQKLRESEKRKSELEKKLLEYKVENSELRQKLRQSEVENEKWRSIRRQMLEIHVTPRSQIIQHGQISC